MKILHTADIHLGAKFKGAVSSAFLRRQLIDTFTKIIDLSINEKADLLLISGDLFDSPCPSSHLIDFAAHQLQRLNIPVCLVPGTHEGELYRKQEDLSKIPNLAILSEPEWTYKEYPSLDTTVYGINPEEKHPLRKLSPKTDSRHQVAILHASYLIPGKTEDEVVVTSDEISSCGMSYIALGHWHSLFNCSQGNVLAWYPGAPEPIAIDEGGAGNVILMDGMNPCIYRIGSIKCEQLEIDLAETGDLPSLKEKISENANPNLRRLVNLKGISSLTLGLDLKQMEEELAPEFGQLQIADNSVLPKEAIDPDTYIHQPFIKRFLELMQEELNSRSGEDHEIAEQALHYGLALLEGKEVL